MGAHNLAVSEIPVGTKGEAYKKAMYDEFSPECLASEGSKEDIKEDVKEGELR